MFMNMKDKFLEIRDNYVINQVRTAVLPQFKSCKIARYRLVFSGRVQHVGFRLEVCEMAKRLGLTGYCQNLEDGSVLAEVQGQSDKIKFLVIFMKSLRRIKIRDVDKKRLPLKLDEAGFAKKE